MNKISEKQIRLLILLAIVLIIFGCYRFGYLRYEEQADSIRGENEILSERVDQLTVLERKKEDYKKDIETSLENIKNAGLEIPSVSFGVDTEIFYSTAVPSTDGLGVSVLSCPLSITYRTTYEGFKECMDYINQYEERMNVENVTASYDATTGNLTGTMVINLFAMSGTDNQYQKPEVSGITIGTDNIFGTAEIPMLPRN